jgi:hypothetical protein
VSLKSPTAGEFKCSAHARVSLTFALRTRRRAHRTHPPAVMPRGLSHGEPLTGVMPGGDTSHPALSARVMRNSGTLLKGVHTLSMPKKVLFLQLRSPLYAPLHDEAAYS